MDNSTWSNWPLGIARVLGNWGTKSTYLFLFIILAIFLTIEVAGRRRAQKKPARE